MTDPLALTEIETPTLDAGMARDELEIEIAALADLGPAAYDGVRKAVAKRLCIRLGTLDRLVRERRSQASPGGKHRRRLAADAGPDRNDVDPLGLGWPVEPWPMPVDGSALLREIVGIVERHIVLPAHGAVAVALWVLHAWAHDSADCSPILALVSPTMRCGKTRLLALIGALVPRPLAASSMTGPAIFRAIAAWRPTVLADEIDAVFGPKGDELLRSVLNTAHDRATARVIRCVGDDYKPTAFSCWTPIVVAGIGKLPGTVADRSIIVQVQRKRRTEQVARLPHDPAGAFLDVRRRCARWIADHSIALRNADPSMPEGLDDRAADNWRPLLAIADVVGVDWPTRARAAAIAMSEGRGDDATGEMIIADIVAIFDEAGADRMRSEALAERLGKLENRPWPEWRAGRTITPTQLAKLLRPFGIAPGNIRIGGEQGKGYRREQFDDAAARYLPPSSRPAVPNGGAERRACDSASVPSAGVGRHGGIQTRRKSANWDRGTVREGGHGEDRGTDGAMDLDPPPRTDSPDDDVAELDEAAR
jgi:putative DNA primase/helicase